MPWYVESILYLSHNILTLLAVALLPGHMCGWGRRPREVAARGSPFVVSCSYYSRLPQLTTFIQVSPLSHAMCDRFPSRGVGVGRWTVPQTLQGRRSLGYAKRGHAHGHLEDHGRGHEFSSACVDAAMPMLMPMPMPMIMIMIMSTSMIMSNTSITCPKTSPISLVVARGICPRESICPIL